MFRPTDHDLTINEQPKSTKQNIGVRTCSKQPNQVHKQEEVQHGIRQALLHKNTQIQYVPLNGIMPLLMSSLKFRYPIKPQAEAVHN